ncbi:hypothetical protein HaLaN_01185, partial [Haematococcus lacustris]
GLLRRAQRAPGADRGHRQSQDDDNHRWGPKLIGNLPVLGNTHWPDSPLDNSKHGSLTVSLAGKSLVLLTPQTFKVKEK